MLREELAMTDEQITITGEEQHKTRQTEETVDWKWYGNKQDKKKSQRWYYDFKQCLKMNTKTKNRNVEIKK